MSTWPRRIALPDVQLPGPTRLMRVAHELATSRAAKAPPDVLKQARLAFARAIADERYVPDHHEVRWLAHLVGEIETERRAAVVDVILRRSDVSVRVLRPLWEDVAERRETLASRIHLAANRASRYDHGSALLPPWVAAGGWERLRDLQRPHEACSRYLYRSPLRIDELEVAVDVLPGSPLGQELLLAAIRDSPDPWWRALGDARAVREWSKLRGLDVQRVAADRQLVAIGEGATSPYDLPDDAEADSLRAWIATVLGDPFDSPGRWRGVSDRAKTIYEWLFVRRELTQILAEFARHAAQRDRSEFWLSEVRRIGDARFVKAGDVAVCMIRVGDRMIVEFGTVGNAAYVYRTPMVPVWLRRLRRLPQAPAAFKDTQALKMPPYAFPYEERVVHHTNWVPRTRALLRAWHPLPTDPAPLRW